MSIKIILTEPEIQFGFHVGELRNKTCREKGYVDRIKDKESSLKYDRDGFIGELVFCKAANIYPDLDSSRAKPFDCQFNGLNLNIKTTRHINGRLSVNVVKKEENRADIYVLITGEIPEFNIIGFRHKEDIFLEKNFKQLYGFREKSYILEQEELLPIEYLIH